MLTRRLHWAGFIIFDHVAAFPEAADVLTRLALGGGLVYDEDVRLGLEQAPEALAALYEGSNRGKPIIRLEAVT